MKYGFFDDKNREYVITNPKTPFPWINYLGNENFFSLISNTGVVTASIAIRGTGELRVTDTTMCLSTMVENTSI